MESKMLDRIAQGLILAGLGYTLHAITRMPEKTLEQVKQMLDDGDDKGVKRLVDSQQDAGRDEEESDEKEGRHDKQGGKDDDKDMEYKYKKIAEILKED